MSTMTCNAYSSTRISFVSPQLGDGQFAFARINGEIYLVQVSPSTPLSSVTPVDVKVFRHEFVTIFRLSETRTIHPCDIRILELIDDELKKYEEESETVFLSRDPR
ncbi:hypothetical protein C8J56DRAFT_480322 [Mycena floridula]|nr:hypothetical protein C8J56DRAFT_480322 [Mycena floridula]